MTKSYPEKGKKRSKLMIFHICGKKRWAATSA
jgi:hypothetical protein